MSALIYLASDTNLKEVKSPHNKTMSVNEALALGIEIPDILNSQAIDKDKPDMILWTDSYTESKEGGLLVDSGFADDISILPINEKMEDVRTKKQYCSMVECMSYKPKRMACAASLPRDWESAVEEAEQDVHYCYVIR